MRQFLFFFVFGLVAIMTGCGLSAREQAVADANNAIDTVFVASEQLAEQLSSLPNEGLTPQSFSGVEQALRHYLNMVDQVNERLRVVGEYFDVLKPYLIETFRPSAESAVQQCQYAMDAFSSEDSTGEELRTAITQVGLCLERYAAAVTNVSAEYGRLSN